MQRRHAGLRPEFLHGEQREDQGSQAARAEPADERHGAAVELRAQAGDGDRDHADDGERQHGVTRRPAIGLLEGRHQHRRPDDEPHEERQHLAGDVGERDRRFELGRQQAAEGHPGDRRRRRTRSRPPDRAGVRERGRAPAAPEVRGTPVRVPIEQPAAGGAARHRHRWRCPCLRHRAGPRPVHPCGVHGLDRGGTGSRR